MINRNDFKYRKPIFVSSIKSQHIRLKNSNIVVENKDGNIITQLSCYNIMMVFIIGDITVTSALIRASKKYGFTIAFMNSMYRVEAMIGNIREGQVVLRKRQYEYKDNELANWIVRNKIRNQVSVITRYGYYVEIQTTIENLNLILAELECRVTEKDSLRGIEGTASRIYFKTLFLGENWKGRKPRQRKDFINAAMDIGYTILFNFIETIVRYYGFDIYIGFYHTEFWTRKSLICDLIEPFRPLIDEKIAKCVQQRKIVPDDFYKENNQLFLKKKKWPEYQIFFADAIMERKDEIFIFIKNFYKCFSCNENFNKYPFFEV